MSRLPSNIERSIKSKTVSCCCEKFRKDTIAKCEKAVGDALQEEIFKSLKGLR